MPGRQYNAAGSTGYRYGYNGKEKSDEIEGNGVDYDYGDRIYDARIGRWFSIDPLQKKYPNWSPYNFVMNSPLKLKDADGKDVDVAIVGNTITFSSTIFVTGPGADDVAKNSNESFSKFSKAALQNRTYKDAEGTVYKVQIQMNFVAVNPSDPKDPNLEAYNKTLNAKVGESGNNILEITTDQNKLLNQDRANAGHPSGENYKQGIDIVTPPNGSQQGTIRNMSGVGNKAYLATKDKDGITAIHETFHGFGLGDRYIEHVAYTFITTLRDGTQIPGSSNDMTGYYAGFENDMMATNAFNFNQEHINNLAAKALDLSKAKGSNFVMADKVDKANNRDKANAADFTANGGNTKYTKK